MMVRRAWMLGLCACSVFPDRAVLPEDGVPSGGTSGAGGAAGVAGVASGGVAGAGGRGVAGSAGMALGGSQEGGTTSQAGTGDGGDSPSEAGSGGAAGAQGGCDEQELMALKANADVWLSELEPTKNQGASLSLEVGTVSGDHAHALVSFPVSDVPPTLEWTTARLEFELRTSPAESRTLALYRVLRVWREGQANWVMARSGNNDWLTPGGDVTPTASARAELHAGASVGERVTFDVTADVLDMAATPAKNFGWLIRYEDEDASRVELGARELGADTPVLRLTSCSP